MLRRNRFFEVVLIGTKNYGACLNIATRWNVRAAHCLLLLLLIKSCSFKIILWVKNLLFYLVLVSCVCSAGVDDDLVYFAKLAKVLLLSEDLGVRQPWRETDHEDQVFLDDADVGQVLPVLGDFLLLGLILLTLLRLDLGHLLPRQRLEVRRVLRVDRTARRARPVPFCPDLVPAETTYLIKDKGE